jgi:hypothetical protein
MPLFLCVGWLSVVASSQSHPALKLPIGQETSFVFGPVDMDGYVDFERAFNLHMRRGVTPDNNAVTLLATAYGPNDPSGKPLSDEFFRHLGMKKPLHDRNCFLEHYSYLRDVRMTPSEDRLGLMRQLDDSVSKPWIGTEYPETAEYLSYSKAALDAVTKAVERPHYYLPLICRVNEDGSRGTLLVGQFNGWIQFHRGVVQCLAARSMLAIGEKRHNDAWNDLRTILRLGSLLIRNGTTSVEVLVGFAISGIGHQTAMHYIERAEPTARICRDIQQELEALVHDARLPDKLRFNERIIYHDIVQNIRRYGYNTSLDLPAKKPTGKQLQRQLSAFAKVDWAPAHQEINRRFGDAYLACLAHDPAKPVTETPKQDRNHDDPVGELFKTAMDVRKDMANMVKELERNPRAEGCASRFIESFFKTMPIVSMDKLLASQDRCHQSAANLRIAFALRAYRADRGAYPQKLQDLVPGYLNAVPNDRFSGKPLRYAVMKDEYLFYSVGTNGKDDGGRGYADTPRGDDLVVRMPIPKAER